MGPQESERAATDDEISTMKGIVADALSAGAIGFASSVGANHIGYDGVPMPSRLADSKELSALVGILGEVGPGIFHIGAGEGERLGVDKLENLALEARDRLYTVRYSTILFLLSELVNEILRVRMPMSVGLKDMSKYRVSR